MFRFYAYIPTNDDKEPLGSDNRTQFELKTVRGAIRRANRLFGTSNFVLFTYRDFYNDKTFNRVYNCGKLFPNQIYRY